MNDPEAILRAAEAVVAILELLSCNPDLDLDGVCDDERVLIQAVNAAEKVLIEFGALVDTVLVQAGSSIVCCSSAFSPLASMM